MQPPSVALATPAAEVAFGQPCKEDGSSVPMPGVDAQVHLSVIDVWAGISSFYDGLVACAFPSVLLSLFGWIECDPDASWLLGCVYPSAAICLDFYSFAWRSWIRPQGKLLVCGGFSCCPLSKAGKRLQQHDRRSRQGVETADLCHFFRADAALLENVPELVQLDSSHGLFTDLCAAMTDFEFLLVATFWLQDCLVRGLSARSRVFPYFEARTMACWLPPVHEIDPSFLGQGGSLQEALEPVDSVSHLVLKGELTLFANPVPFSNAKSVLKVGHFRYRGSKSKLRRGSIVSFRGLDWLVLSGCRQKIQLFHDSRSRPEYLSVSPSQLKSCKPKWKIYPVISIFGTSPTIRRMHLPPVGQCFILDVRISPSAVRPLLDVECYNACSLSRFKLSLLLEAGKNPQPLAGNSIPVTMTTAVGQVTLSRFDKAAVVEAASLAGVPVLERHLPVLCLSSIQFVLVQLVSWESGKPVVWVAPEVSFPVWRGAYDQPSACKVAAQWATGKGQACADLVFSVLELPAEVSRGFLVVFPVECIGSLQLQSGSSWLPVDELMEAVTDKQLLEALLTGVQLLESFQRPTSIVQSQWLAGRVQGKVAAEKVAPDVGVDEEAVWLASVLEDRQAEEAVQMRLRSMKVDSAWYAEWADNMSFVDPAATPASLRRKFCFSEAPVDDFGHDLMHSEPHEPLLTEWAPLPPESLCLPREAPEGWLSGVVPARRRGARDLVSNFMRDLTLWMQGLSVIRPNMVVIPESWFMPWTFEALYEFHSRPGWAVPVRVHQPLPTHLNLDFMEPFLRDYPDQELASFLMLGVRYKADLAHQVVLLPHQQSFLPVQERYLKQADKWLEIGWTVAYDAVASIPWRTVMNGAVARRLEPDRPRITNNASAPHNSPVDFDGEEVVPLNRAIRGDLLETEVKPTASMMVTSMAILLSVAAVLRLRLFLFCDDFASFFNQMRLSPSEIYRTGGILPPRKLSLGLSQPASFTGDTVLGFGITMASNICQRFASWMMNVFCTILDKELEPQVAKYRQQSPSFDQWWLRRVKLGKEQCRLYSAQCYTDDPRIICVGEEVLFRGLKVWRWFTKGMNTMMAIPAKRDIGTSAVWLGVMWLVNQGISAITAQKVIRAVQEINLCLEGGNLFDDYRRLVGFLEHLRQALFLLGNSMYGLYSPHRAMLSSWDAVWLNPLMRQQLLDWRGRVMRRPAASVAVLFPSLRRASLAVQPQLPSLHTSSDAAKEGASTPGLGGWTCGFWWAYALSVEHLVLPIAVLEAIAAVANVVVVAQLLAGGSDFEGFLPGALITMHVDAEATARILIKGRARSPLMQIVHQIALSWPEFCAMLPRLNVSHLFGRSNVPADAASRGMGHVLQAVCKRLKMRSKELYAPTVLIEQLLGACLDHLELVDSWDLWDSAVDL